MNLRVHSAGIYCAADRILIFFTVTNTVPRPRNREEKRTRVDMTIPISGPQLTCEQQCASSITTLAKRPFSEVLSSVAMNIFDLITCRGTHIPPSTRIDSVSTRGKPDARAHTGDRGRGQGGGRQEKILVRNRSIGFQPHPGASSIFVTRRSNPLGKADYADSLIQGVVAADCMQQVATAILNVP